jgi:spore maturation protein CgeB
VKAGKLQIVVCGLSITSSWGNGHATTYRALLRELAARGHTITFLERDVPWYRENRDFPNSDYCDIRLYSGLEELQTQYADLVRRADAVIVGSYVPDGIQVTRWVLDNAEGLRVFYDIDTPVTISDLKGGKCEYLSSELIPELDLYLSFTGGPILREIEQRFGAVRARLLACSVDPRLYYPERSTRRKWALGYLGTYSADRQPKLRELLIHPAEALSEKRFAVAGSLYPADLEWPANVVRIEHLPPAGHRSFYNAQAFTLNVTRQDMVAVGYSPSVRLFEAAACGTAIISDYWVGLDSFFRPGKEILLAANQEDCCRIVRDLSAEERAAISERARLRVAAEHTSAHRARELENYLLAAQLSRRVVVAEPTFSVGQVRAVSGSLS